MIHPNSGPFLLCTALLMMLALGDVQAQDPTLSSDGISGAGFAGRGGQPDATLFDGRLSLRDVYSFDNQTDLDVHLIFLDMNLRGDNLAKVGSGQLNLKLDSRMILDLTQDELINSSDFSPGLKRNERRFGETQTWADVRLLYLELVRLGPVDVATGRLWLYEAGGAWVDGANFKLRFGDSWSAALFGGLSPDPIDYSVSPERQSAGAFVAHQSRRLDVSAAYTLQRMDSELDRQFAFSRGHWNVPVGETLRALFLSYYSSLDLQDGPKLTTFFVNGSTWLNRTLNFSLHYARFATSKLRLTQQSVAPEDNQRDLLGSSVNTGSYDQVRIAAAQRFAGHYHIYQQLDLRQRDLIDNRSAAYYRVGLRDSSVLGTELSLHGRITVRNNFASDSLEFLGEGAYRFGDKLELESALVYQSGRSLVASQSQDVILFNTAGTLDITPTLYMTIDYELSRETNIQQEEQETAGELNIHTFFSRLTYRL